jgi:hypothetical protein
MISNVDVDGIDFEGARVHAIPMCARFLRRSFAQSPPEARARGAVMSLNEPLGKLAVRR